MMQRVIYAVMVATTLMLVSAPWAMAQRGPGASVTDSAKDPERLAAARELYLIAGGGKQLDTVLETMFQQLGAQFSRQKPQHAKEIQDVMQRMAKKFSERKDEFANLIAPVYASEFTAEEMREIIRFYSSGVGKRFVEAQPALMVKIMPKSMKLGEQIAEEALQEARQELKKRGIDL